VQVESQGKFIPSWLRFWIGRPSSNQQHGLRRDARRWDLDDWQPRRVRRSAGHL